MAILRFLRRLTPPSVVSGTPRTDRPILAIGDIHGRDDLLERMLDRLSALPEAGHARLVVLGDMVDRGPGTAAVLGRLREMTGGRANPFAEMTCLMGNHERMMLDFLDDPERHGRRWLRHGGDATLLSFGVAPPPVARLRKNDPGQAAFFADLRDTFLSALPDGMAEWIAALPLIWRDEGIVLSHAGADPSRPIDAQEEEALLWGHPAFARQIRRDGIWCVHGHTVVAVPELRPGRVAIDTGAWRSGRLTAARLGPGGLRFLTVQDEA